MSPTPVPAPTVDHHPTRYYLTDDERVGVVVRGDELFYHLRIWRSRTRPPVVVVAQLPGGPEPARATARLARLVHQAYLHNEVRGMFYLERTDLGLSVVDFEVLGKRPDRLLFVHPHHHRAEPGTLSKLLGLDRD